MLVRRALSFPVVTPQALRTLTARHSAWFSPRTTNRRLQWRPLCLQLNAFFTPGHDEFTTFKNLQNVVKICDVNKKESSCKNFARLRSYSDFLSSAVIETCFLWSALFKFCAKKLCEFNTKLSAWKQRSRLCPDVVCRWFWFRPYRLTSVIKAQRARGKRTTSARNTHS